MKELENNAHHVAETLKILAHPKRLLILCKLTSWAKYVHELERDCTISQSQLSQFLAKMKEEGILASEKQGQFVSYSIADARIVELINHIQKIFCK
jgi:ArsR family transcriptional regulator